MIGTPAARFPRFPNFRVTRLFSHVVPRGWQPAGLDRVAGPSVIASRFAAPDGSDESVLALNNTTRRRDVKIEGLQESQPYFVVAWNRDGRGSLATLPPLESDATGAATVNVPAHGVIALSTRDPLL
jgi:hypothetical protein